MRSTLLATLAVCATATCAQEQDTYFTNVNSELCFELYRTSDRLGEFRVYVVIDEESTFLADTVLLNQWNTLPRGRRSAITQRWAVEGRRIEAERAPYITRPPRFPNRRRATLRPVSNTATDWSVWEGGRTFWMYPDRPF